MRAQRGHRGRGAEGVSDAGKGREKGGVVRRRGGGSGDGVGAGRTGDMLRAVPVTEQNDQHKRQNRCGGTTSLFRGHVKTLSLETPVCRGGI